MLIKSSSTVLATILGTVSLIGCQDIIGEKAGADPAGTAEPGLAAPPAAKVALQEPPRGATQPAKSPVEKKDVGSAPDAEPDAPSETSDDDEPSDGDATEDPTPKKKIEEREERDDDKRERDLGADLTVKRLVISKGVKGREPVGASNTFVEGAQDRIYAFVEVGNRDQVPSELYVTFVDESSGKGGRVPLQVGAGARWRTWIYTRSAKKPGKWRAVVKNAKGKTLASQSFEIKSRGKGELESPPEAKKSKSDKKADKAKSDDKERSEAKSAGDKSADDKSKKKIGDDEGDAKASSKKPSESAAAPEKAGEPKKSSERAKPDAKK